MSEKAPDTPRRSPCALCGKKPAEQIWSMSYGDSDDQLYLQHWCNAKNAKVYFPELKKHPFTAKYVNGQRPLVINAWNEEQAKSTPRGSK